MQFIKKIGLKIQNIALVVNYYEKKETVKLN